jgi:hypothetical protein
MNVVASMVALSALGVGATAAAQDTDGDRDDDGDRKEVISRDREGDVAFRDDAVGFGAEGQMAFSTDAALGFARTTGDNRPASTTITILPALDYFVVENLSIGGYVGVEYVKAGDTRATKFSVGPRVGYNFEISQLLSIWPKIGFSYAYTKSKTDLGETPGGMERSVTVDNNALALNLFAPIMLHPAPHFFAGFGPFLDTDLNGDNRTTTWGFRLTIGGWL